MEKVIVPAALLVGLSLIVGSCGTGKTNGTETANVRLADVVEAGESAVQEFPGRVKASEEVNMAFKVGGTLKNILVEEGGRVRVGQLVAELDPRDYQVQMDAVNAEYQSVKSEAERVIALYADSACTAYEYDKARYGLEQMAAKFDNACNQLADTKIYAPFSGVVQKRYYDTGTVVAAGMPVVSVVSDGNVELEINFPASVYVHRDSLESFYATFDFIPGRKIPLRLISIAPKANANQLYAVRLAISGDVSPMPSPGMNAMVGVRMKGASEGKMEIPSSAVFAKDGTSHVWVYDGAAVRLRDVEVERLHTDGMAVISAGLSAGEQVVASGVHKLSDGQKVKPLAGKSETNVGDLL